MDPSWDWITPATPPRAYSLSRRDSERGRIFGQKNGRQKSDPNNSSCHFPEKKKKKTQRSWAIFPKKTQRRWAIFPQKITAKLVVNDPIDVYILILPWDCVCCMFFGSKYLSFWMSRVTTKETWCFFYCHFWYNIYVKFVGCSQIASCPQASWKLSENTKWKTHIYESYETKRPLKQKVTWKKRLLPKLIKCSHICHKIQPFMWLKCVKQESYGKETTRFS